MSEERLWPEVPRIFNDLPLSADEEAHFQFTAYADTFARLIASKRTRTPLTIGIHFGLWTLWPLALWGLCSLLWVK